MVAPPVLWAGVGMKAEGTAAGEVGMNGVDNEPELQAAAITDAANAVRRITILLMVSLLRAVG
jgi:hypothetical protein